MLFPKDSREYLHLDIYSTVDLSAGTIEVSMDNGSWETWEVSIPTAPARFRDEEGTWHDGFLMTVRRLFAGPDAPDSSGATTLPLGIHEFRWRAAGLTPEQPTRNTSAQVEVA